MNQSDTELLATGDGSYTLFSTQFNEIYHSRHGALAESMHVFIKAGLEHLLQSKKEIHILEIGFGTGLNALLSLQKAIELPDIKLHYTGLEPLPKSWEVIEQLHYPALLKNPYLLPLFKAIHLAENEKETPITENFSVFRSDSKTEDFKSERVFDLIYFDAFAPATQPELWTASIFEKIYGLSSNELSVLVTYCAKGEVKRNMKQAGYQIEALPGPIGKREMTRAFKRTESA